MASALHSALVEGEVHVAHQWAYANQTAREAATGFVTADLHKLALQEDNHSLWMLTAISPVTWARISSTGGTYDANAIHDNEGGEIAAVTEKTTPVAADLVLIEDSAASNAKKRAQVGNLAAAITPVFGSQITYASSEGESSTTASTWQQKVRLTTSSVPAGTYRVGWCYGWSHGTAQQFFQAQVEQDDTTQLCYFSSKPIASGTDNLDQIAGYRHVTLTSGAHTFDLDFRTGASGTAYIREARLEFWRVS